MVRDISKMRAIVLKNVANDFKEDILGNIKILQGVVRTDAFLNLIIPNNANAREYDENSKNVKNMMTTLIYSPESFVLNNNGIRIIASQVRRNTDGTYTIYIDDNEGVVNGNHTANVLRNHGVEKAFVPVLIQISNFTKERLSEISTSLNSHKRLDERSRQDKLDKHDWVKKLLDTNYEIQYHSGGKGSIDVDTVLQRAYVFYADKRGNFHERAGAYRVGKSVFQVLNDRELLSNTQYILKDIMELYDWISDDEQLIKMLSKPNLTRFITKDGKVHIGLALHILSLSKAFMHARHGYTIWYKGVTPVDVKSTLRQNYRNIIDIIKVKKFVTVNHSDILRDMGVISEFEGLRKTIQIDYLTNSKKSK